MQSLQEIVTGLGIISNLDYHYQNIQSDNFFDKITDTTSFLIIGTVILFIIITSLIVYSYHYYFKNRSISFKVSSFIQSDPPPVLTHFCTYTPWNNNKFYLTKIDPTHNFNVDDIDFPVLNGDEEEQIEFKKFIEEIVKKKIKDIIDDGYSIYKITLTSNIPDSTHDIRGEGVKMYQNDPNNSHTIIQNHRENIVAKPIIASTFKNIETPRQEDRIVNFVVINSDERSNTEHIGYSGYPSYDKEKKELEYTGNFIQMDKMLIDKFEITSEKSIDLIKIVIKGKSKDINNPSIDHKSIQIPKFNAHLDVINPSPSTTIVKNCFGRVLKSYDSNQINNMNPKNSLFGINLILKNKFVTTLEEFRTRIMDQINKNGTFSVLITFLVTLIILLIGFGLFSYSILRPVNAFRERLIENSDVIYSTFMSLPFGPLLYGEYAIFSQLFILFSKIIKDQTTILCLLTLGLSLLCYVTVSILVIPITAVYHHAEHINSIFITGIIGLVIQGTFILTYFY